MHSPVAVAAKVVALAISGDNGLPFTAVPENDDDPPAAQVVKSHGVMTCDGSGRSSGGA